MTDPMLCVIGTRPEAIKMAPVVHELVRRHVPHVVVSTGQHRELTAETLAAFEVTVDIDLEVMTEAQTPTMVASRVLAGLDPVLQQVRPASLIVQGDTTTVMAAAIAGAYAQVPVTHLEAGLRTGDRRQPFPEELNRLLAGRAADLHLAPTLIAKKNLLNEGVPAASIVITGNTVIDALYWAAGAAPSPRPHVLAAVDSSRKLVLMTAHRRESFGQPLREAFAAVRDLVSARSDLAVLYPVHPNPEVRGPAEDILGPVDGVALCDPLDYFDLVHAMSACHLVLTDSGGLQEEAPALGKPVLVMRESTERPEAVDAGVARLVGTDAVAIRDAVQHLLDDPTAYAAMARGASPYGDGVAARRVVGALLGEHVQEFDAARMLRAG